MVHIDLTSLIFFSQGRGAEDEGQEADEGSVFESQVNKHKDGAESYRMKLYSPHHTGRERRQTETIKTG